MIYTSSIYNFNMKIVILFLVAGAQALPHLQQNYEWRKSVKPRNIFVPTSNPNGQIPSPRVVNGEEAVPHSYPYQVAIFIDGNSFCGGTLISRNYVMTAAHCCQGASFLKLILGAHDISKKEQEQLEITSNDYKIHEEWDRIALLNDICLVRLPQSVDFNNNIQPVSLAPADSGDFAGDTAVLTGWGKTSGSSNGISPVLMKADLKVLSNLSCKGWFGAYIQNSHICSSGDELKGGCNGDSGGGLVVGGKQVGIVSFGGYGCPLGSPTAYSRVSSFGGWISKNSDV